MSRRIWFVQCFFIFWGIAIFLRLGYWQLYRHADLSTEASRQHTSSLLIPAARGLILARDGFPLVANADNYLLYLNPKQLPPNFPPTKLLDILNTLPSSDSARTALDRSLTSPLSWLAISRNITSSQKIEIEKLLLPGIGFELQPIRTYPEGTPSAYLTGFVGKNSVGLPQGYFGLEGYYDRQLAGLDGKLVEEQDAFGLPIVIGNKTRIPPRPGRNLLTSIDRTIEYIASKKLSAGLEKYQAVSGTVTIMDSKTGQILAMVSLPGYDPSQYTQWPSSSYRNPIISDAYEPGSTFKTIVMASALDAGVVDPVKTLCSICDGPVTIDGYTILSGDGKYYPQNNAFGIIKHSDNVGMVYVSRKLGNAKMLTYLKRFGLGRLTGIDLQEERSPVLRPDSDWYSIDFATASFGQGIAVTPIQMVTAVNAIANKGALIPPRVVTAYVSNNYYQAPDPVKPVQIISLSAATKVTEMMVNGVKTGEVRYYRPQGYMIAGKTGTAQIPIAGYYDKDKTIASFVGFAPANEPKFTMLVTLREPKSSPWGSTTAAPLWFDIAGDLFRYYRIPPQTGL